MIINAAVIKEQGITFAIVAVQPQVIRYTYAAIQARHNFTALFPNMPIILMAQNANGEPRYVGRKDIVAWLKTLQIDQIPWKKFHLY